MMLAKAIVAFISAGSYVVASTAQASCSPDTSDTIVRGRVVRCEDARFHLEASGAYEIHKRDLERALARVGPENRERLLDRLGGGVLTRDFEARVVVVAVDQHVPIVAWLPGVSQLVELKDQPRELHETIRYWWSGPIEVCERLAAGSSIDLWVHAECCDTYEFAAPVCIVAMRYAEPVPDPVREVLTQVFDKP